MRVGHVRLARADRDRVRRRRGPEAAAARSAHAGDARRDAAAAAAAGRRQPLHRLRRRRLLLPRQPRPGGDPDHVAARLRRAADRGSGFAIERDYDLSTVVLPGDKIISALPDWSGRLWFASTNGVVGTVDPKTGAVRSRPLGEKIATRSRSRTPARSTSSPTPRSTGSTAGAGGVPTTVWRKPYANTGVQKPGQPSAGSGTTPTLMGRPRRDHRQRRPDERARLPARLGRAGLPPPVFAKGASATDQSLIGTGRSLVVENNYGYSGPPATQGGKTTSPGLERVDLDAGRRPPHGLAHDGARAVGRAELSLATAWSTRTQGPAALEAPTRGTSPRSTSAPAGRSTSASAARGSASTTTTRRSRSARTGPPTWDARRPRGAARQDAAARSPAPLARESEAAADPGCTCGGWAARARGCG